jgi:hypothetical protein
MRHAADMQPLDEAKAVDDVAGAKIGKIGRFCADL